MKHGQAVVRCGEGLWPAPPSGQAACDQNFGLLQEPPKLESGYRQYPKPALERLHFIKRAQGLGFSLKEISRLLALGDNAPESRAMAEETLSTVGSKITHAANNPS